MKKFLIALSVFTFTYTSTFAQAPFEIVEHLLEESHENLQGYWR